MHRLAVLLLALGTAWAGPPKAPECVATPEKAVEIARTRGKLIFLTVIVDNDAENRAVIDNVFRDRSFLRIAEEFVILYANNDCDHGVVKVEGADGKTDVRCADCPSIRCEDHMMVAQGYARGFYPTNDCRTPVHFVLNGKEEVVATIMNGSFEQGFNHVPAKQVVTQLKKLLDKHGRGLTEEQYKHMLELLVDARAARARDNTTLELQKLAEVVALERDVEGVRTAKARIQEIDAWAAKKLEQIEPLIEARQWEEALDALQTIQDDFPGTLTAAAAGKRRDDLLGEKEVKRLLKAAETYERAKKYLENRKYDLARKYFEKCIRLYGDTRYATLSAEALAAMPSNTE